MKKQLYKAGVRVEIDDRQEKIGKKIREAELSRVPYMLVVGEKEVTENKVKFLLNFLTEEVCSSSIEV